MIQHAFSKPSLVNLISKDVLISLPSLFTLQTREYDVMIYFCVIPASLGTSFKKCSVMMT